MTRAVHHPRRLVLGLLATALLAPSLLAAPADAAPAQEDPTTSVLAIVSPIALPVCSLAGSATLLVPILGGLVGDSVGVGDTIDVADLVLDTIGPVYVVCGTLPASPGTRCELDATIAGVWPAELTSVGVAAPAVVGGVADSLSAMLALLGSPPVPEVVQTLSCVVPSGGTAPDAPPEAPAPSGGPLLPGAPTSSLLPSGALVLPPADRGSPSSTTTPGPVPVVGALTSMLDDQLPGGLRALQALVALTLGLCLLRSWYTSWRITRSGPDLR